MERSASGIFEDEPQPLKPFYAQKRFWAWAVVILLQLSAVLDVGAYFQTEYQLVSPLIPHEIVDQIARPYLLCAAGLGIASLPALILQYFGKHRLVIIVAACALLVQYGYFTSLRWG